MSERSRSAGSITPLAPTVTRAWLLDCPVDLFDKDSLLGSVQFDVEHGRKKIYANINLHALYCLEISPAMRRLFMRDDVHVHIDGMPIVWLLRSQGAAARRNHRLTYLDWASGLLDLAERRGWRVAYIGSTEEICKKGVGFFRARHPALSLKGWAGYFNITEFERRSAIPRVLSEVIEYNPNILIMGMGMPRQEEFLDAFADRLPFNSAFCSGAFLEYFVGGQRAPPRWFGKYGIEWVYRLAFNPRRYWFRYLVEPGKLIVLVLKRRAGRQ